MGQITNNTLVDKGLPPLAPADGAKAKARLRRQMIAQQEFVRAKAHARLSERGMYLAFDAAADMRDVDRWGVIKYVLANRKVRKRERLAIAKMVYRIDRRIKFAGKGLTFGPAARWASE